MKFFGFRPKTLLFFGLGFLLGSRAGRGPWEKAMALWSELQGKAQSQFGGDGHLKGKFEGAKDHFQEAGAP